MSLARHSRSEEHTSELQSHSNLVCRLLLEKKNSSVFDPLSAFPVEARRVWIGIEQPQQDDRFTFSIFQSKEIVPLPPHNSLHITIQADQFLDATAQPTDVTSTRGQKEHPQALVFVARVPGPRGPVAKDTNRPIAIQKTAGQRYEERVRNIDSPER